MISINNSKVDLLLQVEEHTNINLVYKSLSLDIDNVLILCPNLFLQRFIQDIHESLDSSITENIESMLNSSNGFVSFKYRYKNKEFTFNFIVLINDSKLISNPFKGEQIINIGFNKINI